jgi:hypothetical protein
MSDTVTAPAQPVERTVLAGIAAVSAALLMTELALTRIFSVTMYYHFAFLAISIALFGLSASGVFVFVTRRHMATRDTNQLLTAGALIHAIATLVALASLVRIRVGLSYSPGNLVLMLTIYTLAALPFFSGGFVISLAFARLTRNINLLYAADLLGAALGCLLLIPLLNQLGAPGVVLVAAGLGLAAATAFASPLQRRRTAMIAGLIIAAPLTIQFSGGRPFDIVDTKGHQGDRVLFAKWNSFSRVAVYDRNHGDWSLSPRYQGPKPESRLMDIDSAASPQKVKGTGKTDDAG